MAQRLPDLIEQYGHKQVENVVTVLDRLFGNGYAEKNLDVAATLLGNGDKWVVDSTNDVER